MQEKSGDIAGALQTARRGLDEAQSSGNSARIALAMVLVARYRFRLGQYDAARRLAEQALVLTDPAVEELAPPHADALLILGMCAAENGSLAQAEYYDRLAADEARAIGNSLLRMRALHNLSAAVYLFRGHFDLAETTDEEALRIARQYGYDEWQVYPLIILSILAQVTGRPDRTRQYLTELRKVSPPDSAGEGYACYVEAMLALDEGRLNEAAPIFGRGLSVADALGDPSLNLDVRLGMGRLQRLAGDAPKAAAWAEDALGLAERVGYPIYQGRARLERARAAWLLGDLSAAETDLRQAEAYFSELEMDFDLTLTRLLLAAIFHETHHPQAGPMFEQAAAAILTGGYTFLLDGERALVHPLIAAHLNSRAAAALLEALQRVPPEPLHVRLLGGLEVRLGGRTLDAKALRARRAGELLALLLISPGNSLTNEQAAETLCPENGPCASQTVFQHACSALRRALEPDLPDRRFPSRYLEVADGQIRLNLPPGSTLDMRDFQSHIRRGEWQAAIDLYRGDLLPELRYAEWPAGLRESLLLDLQRALLALAEQRLAEGCIDEALNLARRLLALDAWQEAAAGVAMRALAGQGNLAAAVRIYRKLEAALRADLDIAPQAEIQALYRRLLASKE
jgi:DNA-binding SARP family transcriptional activator